MIFDQQVIFSQSSDTIERQASMCSSSEEASLVEGGWILFYLPDKSR